MSQNLINTLNSKLPQTQCQKCGYPSCLEYAKAINTKNEDTNRCIPGGEETHQLLNEIQKTGKSNQEMELSQKAEYKSAKIIESQCIGCTLCIRACPFDAIVGSKKRMHTVLTDHCTGCELCVPVCPVDCIEIRKLSDLREEGNSHAEDIINRSYYSLHQKNLARYQEASNRKKRENIRKDTHKTKGIRHDRQKDFDDRSLESKELLIATAIKEADARIKSREKLNRFRQSPPKL